MKIMFFGDSITDAGRNREDPASLGEGYVCILHEKLKNLYENIDFVFLNRGISHNRIADVEAQIRGDLAEKPDIAVLLIGINDIWSRGDMIVSFDAEKFAASYENVLKELGRSGAKIIVVEPFLFNVPDKRRFRRDFDRMAAIVRELAEKYADAFVPLDEMFAGVSQSAGISAYSEDGIHPTHRASRLIADNVIKKISLFL